MLINVKQNIQFVSEDLVVNNGHRLDPALSSTFAARVPHEDVTTSDKDARKHQPNTQTQSHRKHPGIVNCRKVTLPDALKKAVQYLIQSLLCSFVNTLYCKAVVAKF